MGDSGIYGPRKKFSQAVVTVEQAKEDEQVKGLVSMGSRLGLPPRMSAYDSNPSAIQCPSSVAVVWAARYFHRERGSWVPIFLCDLTQWQQEGMGNIK